MQIGSAHEDKPSDLARLKRSGLAQIEIWSLESLEPVEICRVFHDGLEIEAHVVFLQSFQWHRQRTEQIFAAEECHTSFSGSLLPGLHYISIHHHTSSLPVLRRLETSWRHPRIFFVSKDLNFLHLALAAAASPGAAALQMLRGLLAQTATWQKG